jgi:hypothetical protein
MRSCSRESQAEFMEKILFYGKTITILRQRRINLKG